MVADPDGISFGSKHSRTNCSWNHCDKRCLPCNGSRSANLTVQARKLCRQKIECLAQVNP